MAYDGNGNFNRLYNWQNDAANGINIMADRMDAEMDGFAAGLSNAFLRDGQATMSANADIGNNRLLRVADPSVDTDGVNKGWVDANFLSSSGDTTISGEEPSIIFQETDQVADLNQWRIGVDDTDFVIEPLQSDGSEGDNFGGVHFTRTISGFTSLHIDSRQPYPFAVRNSEWSDLRDGWPGFALDGNIDEKIVTLDIITEDWAYDETLAVFQPYDLDYLGEGTDAIYDETVLLHGMATREFVNKTGDEMTGDLTIDQQGNTLPDDVTPAPAELRMKADAEASASLRMNLVSDPAFDAQALARRNSSVSGGADELQLGSTGWDATRIVAKTGTERSIQFYSGGTYLDASIGSDGFFLWNNAGDKTASFERSGAITNWSGNITVDRRGDGAGANFYAFADNNQNAGFRVGSQDGSTQRFTIGRAASTDYLTLGASGWSRNEYLTASDGSHRFYCGTSNVDARIDTGRFRVYSGGTAQLDVDGGNFQSVAIRDNLTTNNANVRVATSGSSVMRSTSSGAYKTDVRYVADESDTGKTVDALRPRVFRSTADGDDPTAMLAGFITEELAEDFPLAVEAERAEHGEAPQNYDDRAIIALLTAELQNVRRRIEVLENP